MIFIVGVLLGILTGGGLGVRYMRHEISADVEPQLRRLQLQLDNLEAAVNLALITRSTYLEDDTAKSGVEEGAITHKRLGRTLQRPAQQAHT